MKNTDLPHIKTLLADDYQENLHQSNQLFENLAQEQNFTYEFLQLPTLNQGSSPNRLTFLVIFLSIPPFRLSSNTTRSSNQSHISLPWLWYNL